MKLMPLHKIAAPSPSVLSFLRAQVRHAFDSPTAQCPTLKRQRCTYGTVGRIPRGSDLGIKDGKDVATRRYLVSSELPALQRSSPGSRTAHVHLAALRPCLAAPNASGRHKVNPSGYHSFSSISANRVWQLFGGRKGREPAGLQPPQPYKDPTDAPTGFDSLGRMTRAANELKMRCTELDEQGNVTMVSGEFKKSELIAKVRLLLIAHL